MKHLPITRRLLEKALAALNDAIAMTSGEEQRKLHEIRKQLALYIGEAK